MKYFFYAVLIFASLASKANDLPGVYKIIKDTRIYNLPDTKSEIVGEAAGGTPIILRKLSKSGQWSFVEDEEKNQGWIPTAKTNYVRPQPQVSEKKIEEDAEKERLPIDEEEVSLKSKKTHFFVWGTFSNRGGGPLVGLYRSPNNMQSPTRARMLGLETGFYRAWKPVNASDYTIPVRLRMMARGQTSKIISGPDLGALFRIHDTSWGSALGYSIGIAPQSSGLRIMIRGGFEFGGPTHALLEVHLGYEF